MVRERDTLLMGSKLDNPGFGVILTDSDSRVRFLNASAAVATGYSAVQARCLPLQEVFQTKVTAASQPLETVAVESGSARSFQDSLLVGGDGTQRGIVWFTTSMTENISSSHGITQFVPIVTENTLSEIRCRQYNKLTVLEGVVRSGLHDLINALNGIMNYSELLRFELPNVGEVRDCVDGITEESRRLQTIIECLRHFIGRQKETFSTVTLHNIVESTRILANPSFRKDQIELLIDEDENLPEVRCQSRAVEHLLLNLLDNARESLNQRYPTHHPNKQTWIRLRQFDDVDGRWARITVEDHGAGVPFTLRERIFDPFFTTKAHGEGVGLGLAISRDIAQEQGGRLSLGCTDEGMTQIHLDLPCANSHDRASTPPDDEEGN